MKNSYFLNLLISLDQFVNVALSPLLSKMLKEGGYEFGNPDETLSSVFGKNVESDTCKACKFICKYILHPLDKNHCRNSIEIDNNLTH